MTHVYEGKLVVVLDRGVNNVVREFVPDAAKSVQYQVKCVRHMLIVTRYAPCPTPTGEPPKRVLVGPREMWAWPLSIVREVRTEPAFVPVSVKGTPGGV